MRGEVRCIFIALIMVVGVIDEWIHGFATLTKLWIATSKFVSYDVDDYCHCIGKREFSLSPVLVTMRMKGKLSFKVSLKKNVHAI